MALICVEDPVVRPASRRAADLRAVPRVSATLLPLDGASLVGGPAVTLVDLSLQGVLLECSKRLGLDLTFTLRLKSKNQNIDLVGTVLRSSVSSVSRSQVTYRVAGQLRPRDEVAAAVLREMLEEAMAGLDLKEAMAGLDLEVPEPVEAPPGDDPFDGHPAHSDVLEFGTVNLDLDALVRATQQASATQLERALELNRW